MTLIQSVDTPERDAVPLDKEQGTGFDWRDSMFLSFQNGAVFDYSDYESRDLNDMLSRDGKARTLDQVLTLPIRRAVGTFKPPKDDVGQTEWLQDVFARAANQDGMSTPLNLVLGQATGGIIHKRAYFEKCFAIDSDGRVVYDKLAWRPPTTCRMLRDPDSGAFRGFEQDRFGFLAKKGDAEPVPIKARRAAVYIHGTHRNPIGGVSDLEIAYWCYKTKQKIMLLWFQFLENQSLPGVVVESSDITVATDIASKIAKMRGRGVLPVGAQGGNTKITTLDTSGKGGDQFLAALQYLDSQASNSVLAGFTDLAGAAASGKGSFALSKDQTDFFLSSRQAVADEIAQWFTHYVAADLVKYNFGPRASVPCFEYGPLAEQDQAPTLTLLEAVIAAPSLNVPREFVQELAVQAAAYLNLNVEALTKAFEDASFQAEQKAKSAGAPPPGQAVAGIAGAVGRATRVVRVVQGGGGAGGAA